MWFGGEAELLVSSVLLRVRVVKSTFCSNVYKDSVGGSDGVGRGVAAVEERMYVVRPRPGAQRCSQAQSAHHQDTCLCTLQASCLLVHASCRLMCGTLSNSGDYLHVVVVCALQLHGDISLLLSHDWPNEITRYGNKAQLFRKKPYFQQEVRLLTCTQLCGM